MLFKLGIFIKTRIKRRKKLISMPIFNLSDIRNINQKCLLLKRNFFFIKRIATVGLIQEISFKRSLARIFIKPWINS